MQDMSHTSWNTELQDVKQRILSYQSFIEQSGPRVSTHPPLPASRLLTVVVLDEGMHKKN